MDARPSLEAIPAFHYTALPSRVLFGFGTIASVGTEVRRLGCERAVILSTPGRRSTARVLAEQLDDLAAGIISEAAMHTPVEVTEVAVKEVRRMHADCIIALGGGSTVGLGKAIALRTSLPQIAIPTTYAGSEATPILGETRDGHKTTQRNLELLPKVIVYDVDLSLSLPPSLSATSGLNAIAHAVEALYAHDANPVTSTLAEQGIAALAQALPIIVAEPGDRAARSHALFGAWACGICLGSVGMALHHKLCHTLGGSFQLPHAETHAVVLPYAVAHNAPAAPAAMARLAHALRATDAIDGLWTLARRLGAPASLREIGMKEMDIDRAAEIAVANPYWNPRAVEKNAIRQLLEAAYRGQPAAACYFPPSRLNVVDGRSP